MNVLLICVSYNSNEVLRTYIRSIVNAYDYIENKISLKVLIPDNSDTFSPVDSPIGSAEFCHFSTGDNLGYLGAVTYAINKYDVDLKEWDYLVISNVDVKLDISFFSNLVKNKYSEDIAWIAPSVISSTEEVDKNPHIIKRYSLSKIKGLRLLYHYPILYYIYTRFIYSLRNKIKKSSNIQNDIKAIYAGHGSLMIFTRYFLMRYNNIVYPSFLYSEEIFFAEEVRRQNLKCIYDSTIVCYEDEDVHISTSKMPRREFFNANYKSLQYIINTYY